MAVTTGAGCSLIIGHLGVWSAGIRLIIVVRIRLRRPRSLAGKGYFAECGKLSRGNVRKILCGFFCGMKGKVWNETMRNVAEMNIY